MTKKLIQIKFKFSDRVLFEGRYESIKECLLDAVKQEKDLRGAYLRGAYLSGAYLCDADLYDADLCDAYLCDADLRSADLCDADLCDADLRSADLSGADLRSADLSGADLSGADLSGADLRGADLRGADLRGAYLCDADLSGAHLRGADLSGADLSGAYLRGADLRDFPECGKIQNIHQTVYEVVAKEGALDMNFWHSCGTAQCRAGWVVTLAGDAGKMLEWALGTPVAVALIYQASDPSLEKIPDFYCGNEEALNDMKRLAESEASMNQQPQPADDGEA